MIVLINRSSPKWIGIATGHLGMFKGGGGHGRRRLHSFGRSPPTPFTPSHHRVVLMQPTMETLNSSYENKKKKIGSQIPRPTDRGGLGSWGGGGISTQETISQAVVRWRQRTCDGPKAAELLVRGVIRAAKDVWWLQGSMLRWLSSQILAYGNGGRAVTGWTTSSCGAHRSSREWRPWMGGARCCSLMDLVANWRRGVVDDGSE